MTEDDELFADMPRAYIRGLEKEKGMWKKTISGSAESG